MEQNRKVNDKTNGFKEKLTGSFLRMNVTSVRVKDKDDLINQIVITSKNEDFENRLA